VTSSKIAANNIILIFAEIAKKWQKLKILDARHVEYDISKHFAAFGQHFSSPEKKMKNTFCIQKCLDHLLLMM